MKTLLLFVIVFSNKFIYGQETQINHHYLEQLTKKLKEPGDEIELRLVFWSDNLWEGKNLVEIKTLAKYLKKIKNCQIRIENYTDCRGKRSYNQDVSKYRAREIRRKLIVEGILSQRIVSQGKGERDPKIDCKCDKCSEEEHSLNRRTIISLVKNDN